MPPCCAGDGPVHDASRCKQSTPHMILRLAQRCAWPGTGQAQRRAKTQGRRREQTCIKMPPSDSKEWVRGGKTCGRKTDRALCAGRRQARTNKKATERVHMCLSMSERNTTSQSCQVKYGGVKQDQHGQGKNRTPGCAQRKTANLQAVAAVFSPRWPWGRLCSSSCRHPGGIPAAP